MREFELDEESVFRAQKLSARMLQDLRFVSEQGPSFESRRELFSDRRYAEEAHRLPINDVVANVGRLATELASAPMG